jgi:hypothetical protein
LISAKDQTSLPVVRPVRLFDLCALRLEVYCSYNDPLFYFSVYPLLYKVNFDLSAGTPMPVGFNFLKLC